MKTELLSVDEKALKKAEALLLAGQVVAFPTETVYGLGAWAFSEEGIRHVYEAKGRPSDNPLIVHVAPGMDLHEIASEIPEKAKFDGEYAQNLSFAFDLKCFFRTIGSVFTRSGVVEGGTGEMGKRTKQ